MVSNNRNFTLFFGCGSLVPMFEADLNSFSFFWFQECIKEKKVVAQRRKLDTLDCS